MVIPITDSAVVVLRCGIGSLAIMRSLGKLGIRVIGIAQNDDSIALRSRYCADSHTFDFSRSGPDELEDLLHRIAGAQDAKPILLATTDETAIFVADSYEKLSADYQIAQNSGPLVSQLANKMTMWKLAVNHNVPVPYTVLPSSVDEAREYANGFQYPVMLKGAMGNRLYQKSGLKMMAAHNEQELIEYFLRLEDPENPNVMIQELIPGPDDEVYIFNGFFNADSYCTAGFTGKKIRQYPIHKGCASMGECRTFPEVSDMTIRFMREIGYKGILDIGYRKDPRDGQYKVLDINPRVGQAFRIFVDEHGMDVVRAMYLSLTNQPLEHEVVPREGRRWIIEDMDAISALDNRREGLLTYWQWIKSMRRVEEAMFFDIRDPMPFLLALKRFLRKFLLWNRKKLRRLLGRSVS